MKKKTVKSISTDTDEIQVVVTDSLPVTTTQPTKEIVADETKKDKIVVFDSFVADLEDILDLLFKSDYKYKFSTIKYITAIAPNVKSVKRAIEYYEAILNDVSNHPDDFYGTKKQYETYVNFLKSMVDDFSQYLNIKTANRKPRKIKKKSDSELVKNLEFKLVSGNIVSCDPETIIGASMVILLNDKYNSISVIVPSMGNLLSAKGKSIINIDDTNSFSKKLRKSDNISELLIGTDKAVRRKIEELKTKSQKATGIINSNILLLKVFK